MELVEGRSLAELIPPDGLPDETVVRHAAPVARALAHAHARRVVHRDLKTANVVVGTDGRPKLLDFGLSRLEPAAGAMSEASSAGVVVGTPQYLAPELLLGARAREASDLWSLGVVLYEMCAGGPPFAGAHMAALVTAILHDPPAPLPAHTGAGLRAVVTRCLAKDPQQRYRSADEVAAALEALAAGAGPRPRGRRRMWAGWIVSLVLLAGVAALALDLGGWRTRLTGGSPIRSLAVLPLVNLPSDPAQEYFADGMTEQLIADLAQIRGLRVISRTSVMRFKGTTAPLAEITRTLRVDAVVEGSVQRDSGLVRIRVRLVDARSEEPRWAASFDRPLRDVLALQSEVAQEVTDRVRTHLSGAERERLESSADVDPVAFDHYLRGRYALSKSPPAVAIAEFRQAIAIDVGYSRAYAGLAHALVRAQALGDSTVEAVRVPALAASARAVELDGDSAEGFLAQANVKARLDWDIPGAERSARRALDLAPGDAEAHHTYGLLAGVQGRLDECIAELKRARERDPLNPYYHEQLGQVLIYARRDDRAIAELGRMRCCSPATARDSPTWAGRISRRATSVGPSPRSRRCPGRAAGWRARTRGPGAAPRRGACSASSRSAGDGGVRPPRTWRSCTPPSGSATARSNGSSAPGRRASSASSPCRSIPASTRCAPTRATRRCWRAIPRRRAEPPPRTRLRAGVLLELLDVVHAQLGQHLGEHAMLVGLEVPAGTCLDRAEGVDGVARGVEVLLDLPRHGIHELAQRHHAGLLQAEHQLQEQGRLAGGGGVGHGVPSAPVREAALASSHRASISSSVACEGVRPCSASRRSMWWKRSRKRWLAARSSRSGSMARWRARFTTANSRSPTS